MKETADGAIAAFYNAAIDSGQWTLALEQLTALADGRAANCFVHDLHTHEFLEYRFVGYGSNWARDYAAHYHRLDLARHELLSRPSGTMYPMHQFVSDSVIDGSEYYQDFYMREGLRYSCGGTWLDGNKRIILAVHRPVGHRHYEAETVRELQRVLVHLPSVLRVRDMAAQSTGRMLITSAALDALPHAVCVVDSNLSVRYINSPAKSALETSGAKVEGNRLVVQNGRESQSLAHAVKRVCIDAPSPVARPVYLASKNDHGHLEIQVVPLDAQLTVALGSPQPLAMLLFREVFRKIEWSTSMKRPFDLSAAEIEIVEGIVAGLAPFDLAAQRGVKISTVRSHIKSVLAKTGCRRIAQVAALFANRRFG